MMFISPAQGAVFAPLALKVPNKTIIVDVTPTDLLSPRTRNKNVGAIVGGIISGVAAIFAVIGIATFVQRQRRRKRKPKPNRVRPMSSFSTDSIQAGSVTPFNPNFPEATQDSMAGITTEQQPISQPMAPVPVGLSGKELARLRTEVLTSQQADNPRGRGSGSNVPQLTLSPTAVRVAETGEAALPSDTRRLHSEVESLRREMERFRAEGLAIAAPPSYSTQGDG
ncbi:hypothetical protein F5888DRAFT_1733240 [Russula emetica]|nr:hypothetical protein F5888DRAFT_1733240 [Russula emetica]